MIYASFGGLLKDFRIRKSMTQKELAYAMGWSESSRLSRIEQGKTKKPERETVNQLMQVLKLDHSAKSQLLLAGAYLPTKKEIEKMRSAIRKMLDNWQYPAYLLDFSWRLLAWNKAAALVYEINEETTVHLKKNFPYTIKMIFDPDFTQNKYLTDKKEIKKWQNVLLEKLIRFKHIHQNRTGEKWYKDIINNMIKNKLFARLWKRASLKTKKEKIVNYERKTLVNPQNIKKRFDFHILRSPLLQDIRFEINYHLPGNIETFKYFS